MENESNEREFLPTFLGFTIYDLIHLICSSILLGLAYAHRSGDWLVEASKASAEIMISLLLVAFILTMAKKRENPKEVEKAFYFAWLTAAAGLALSSSCMIPYLIEEAAWRVPVDPELACFGVAIGLTFTAFILFFASLFVRPEKMPKHVLCVVAMFLILLSVPLSIVGDCLYNHEPFERVVAILVDLAPLFMIGIGLSSELKLAISKRKK